MDFQKLSALLLILMIFISTAPPILACGYCSKHPPKGKPPKKPTPPISLPPVIVKPPVTVPPVIVKPPVTVPPVTLPPVIGKPPVTLPPGILPPVIGNPPVTVPPVTGKPPVTGPGCSPPPPASESCPIDTLKLGACVDLLGGLVHIGLGDPVINTCCPILQGLVELEAAICLCTTIKIKLLNLNIILPIALQVLATCGKTPPPGFTCTL